MLTAAAADVGAVLDYPDEAEETDVDLRPIGAALDKLIDGYPAGTAAHDGVRVTLTGTVNAGKSTLFNALLGKDRAIVTDIPGTTRDTVTDSYEYKGVRFYLTDTAGVREATDAVERLGIERSRAGLFFLFKNFLYLFHDICSTYTLFALRRNVHFTVLNSAVLYLAVLFKNAKDYSLLTFFSGRSTYF